MNFGVYPNLTRDYILKRITQEQIMEKYLNISVVLDTLIVSPLRNDRNPTCSFYYNKHGRLRLRDFSGHFWGDCFDVVGFRLGIDTSDKKGFAFILHTIAKDFRINKYENSDAVAEYNLKTDFFFKQNKHKKPAVFHIVFREYDSYDKHYWSSINVSKDLLRLGKVYFAQEIYVSKDDLPFVNIYRYSVNNPAYCYYGGKYSTGILKWKIYLPMKKQRGENGFYSNSSFLQGKHLLTCGRICIITKSYKDALVFHSIGIHAVAPTNEATLLTKEDYWFLKSKYDFLISCMDYDRAGMKMAKQLRDIYKIDPIMFTNGNFNSFNYGAKDASDYIKLIGVDSLKNIIRNLYAQYIEDFRKLDKQTYKLLKNCK